MDLTVLGCSGSYPSVDCACSGYLVRTATTSVVVDLGPGCLATLQRHVGIDAIDGIVLSHSHADHWTDLASFHVASKYRFEREGVPVFGTASTRSIADHLISELEPTLVWSMIGDGAEFAIGDLAFATERTDHYVETLAIRIDAADGTSMAYSADTGPDWSMRRLGRGVDLALIESTYPTDVEASGLKHLSASMAGEMARDAGAKRCVLTHFWPDSDRSMHERNGSTAYGAPVELASPDERYVL